MLGKQPAFCLFPSEGDVRKATVNRIIDSFELALVDFDVHTDGIPYRRSTQTDSNSTLIEHARTCMLELSALVCPNFRRPPILLALRLCLPVCKRKDHRIDQLADLMHHWAV